MDCSTTTQVTAGSIIATIIALLYRLWCWFANR